MNIVFGGLMRKLAFSALAATAFFAGTASASTAVPKEIQDALLGQECVGVPRDPQGNIQSVIGAKGPDGSFVLLHAYSLSSPSLAGNHATSGWPWVKDKAPRQVGWEGEKMTFRSEFGSDFRLWVTGPHILTGEFDSGSFRGVKIPEMRCEPVPSTSTSGQPSAVAR